MLMNMNRQIREVANRAFAQSDWTQEDLAKKVGVKQATISRFLTGERGKADSVLSILDALGLELVAVPKGADVSKLFEKGEDNG